MISRDVIEAIRERTAIEEVVAQTVTLVRKGNSLMGLCPFHQEKSPSFSVVPAKGIYHCFGCGEGGDAFGFISKTRGISFFEAVKELGESCGVPVEDREMSPDERRRLRSRATLHEVCELACKWFQSYLLARPEGRIAREYMSKRGLEQAFIERYRLGFAPEGWDGLLNHLHSEGVSAELCVKAGLAKQRKGSSGAYDMFRSRIIVPIEDARGRVVAFGGRVLPGAADDVPKYVNSPETEIYKKSSILYGLSRARSAVQRKGRMLVVEGYFDVLSLHQAGFEEAVATCGTALTTEHVKAIRPLTRSVVALFDSDEAGLRAAVKSLDMFLDAGIEPRRLELVDAKDPDELVQRDGPEALEALLRASEPLFELVLRRAVRKFGTSPGGRSSALLELAPVIRRFDATSRSVVVARVASALGVHEQVVAETVGAARSSGPGDQPVAAPARWRGNVEVNHLLWLLVHFPVAAGPPLAGVDPELVSDRPSVLMAIGLLMAGESVAAVCDRVDDPDLSRVIRVASAKEGLYDEDRAANAVTQILDRLKLNRIGAELGELDRQLAGCTRGDDRSRYFELLSRRQQLQMEKTRLGRSATRARGGGSSS